MRWVTYFPEIENTHLTKDPGLIPWYVQKQGYDAALVTNKILGELPSLQSETRGLQVGRLPDRGKRFFVERSALNFFRTEGANIDVLHLFHLSRHSLIYGLIYKRVNPKGKLYLKLDAYNDHLSARKKFSKNPLKQFIFGRIEKKFHAALDLVSIENTEGFEIAIKTYPEWENKLQYLPNGVNDVFLKEHFKAPFKKEKIILSVGRLGSSDKNYELLLAALPQIKLPDWKFAIVGPISDDFQLKIDEFFGTHPEWRDRISFTGSISDRKKLYELYSKASVFFLPSRFESFGISFVEALYFGAYLVGHKGMYAYRDICKDGEYGCFFEDNDPTSFAATIEEAASKSSAHDFAKKASEYGRNSFSWSKLIEKLIAKLGHD